MRDWVSQFGSRLSSLVSGVSQSGHQFNYSQDGGWLGAIAHLSHDLPPMIIVSLGLVDTRSLISWQSAAKTTPQETEYKITISNTGGLTPEKGTRQSYAYDGQCFSWLHLTLRSPQPQIPKSKSKKTKGPARVYGTGINLDRYDPPLRLSRPGNRGPVSRLKRRQTCIIGGVLHAARQMRSHLRVLSRQRV